MSKRVIAIIVAIMVISATESKAQIGSFIKDKAQKAVVKGLKNNNNEKIEEEQQEQQPKQEQKSQKQTDPANNFMQQKMMGMMGFNNVKYDLNYNYTSSMKMDIESVDSASTEVNKGTYTTYFDKNSKNFAMEFESVDKESGQSQKSLMIFDYKNLAMLILSEKDGEKSGMAMPIDSSQAQTGTDAETQQTETAEQEDLSNYNMYYKATGRTKNIAGYNCKEYTYENPEGKAEIWATNDIKYDYSNAYGQMGGLQALATGGAGAYLMGTVLEMHFKDSDSNARSDLFVKEINTNTSKSFNISDYQIIGIGGDKTKQ